jgi:tRNA G10  N-methylase Trm11
MNIEQAKTLVILGRQPALGVAELEALNGAEHLLPFGNQACLLDIPTTNISFERLGGTIKLCRLLASLPSSDWTSISDYLSKTVPKHAELVTSKLTIGLSVYGIRTHVKQIERTLLSLKKVLKAQEKSIRIVPNKQLDLNSAQIIHNKLTSTNGWELVVISDGTRTLLAQTVHVQDIEGYTARDQARPARDAKVGMLPPKLAQIIVNLATGPQYSKIQDPSSELLLLDPFCGTGVVLQEASLMGYDVFGTDIEPRMIEYSIENMQWLRDKFPEKAGYLRVELADATSHQWNPKPQLIACETYLGKPLASLPTSDVLSKIIYEANLINHRFLQNISRQLVKGTRLCVAVPTWRGKHEFLHLPMLDHLTDMGYTRVRFKHVRNEDLIYHRENQVVGRELLVLEKA